MRSRLRSRLHVGTVWHKRWRPKTNEFTYKVLYFHVDVDELKEMNRALWLFSYNGANAYAINDRDHAGLPGRGIASAARERLGTVEPSLGEGPVTLLTQASSFGYVFNPVSFYFAGGLDDAPKHILAEVHNRLGQRHVYDLLREGASRASGYSAAFKKEFYVSPFIGMDAQYAFSFHRKDQELRLSLDEYDNGGLLFQARLTLAPIPLTDASLAKALITHPLTPMKTVAMIYRQALKLKLRGLPYLQSPVKKGR